jgi:hypothetical protein
MHYTLIRKLSNISLCMISTITGSVMTVKKNQTTRKIQRKKLCKENIRNL